MNNKKPIHKVHDGGYFDSHIDTECKLGDSFDKGFENGTIEWDKVTCKSCKKLRERAAKKAKYVYKKYHGVEYKNKTDR